MIHIHDLIEQFIVIKNNRIAGRSVHVSRLLLVHFCSFLAQKKIAIYTIKKMCKEDVVEYYLYLRHSSKSDTDIEEKVRCILRFVYFLEYQGFVKNEPCSFCSENT
jgi:site-specific recombinase XerD